MASNYQQKIQERKLKEANEAGRTRSQAIKAQQQAEDAAAEWWATPTVPQAAPLPATNQPAVYGPPKPPYVVKDGDTVDTIANQFGTTPTNLLNSNPDVTSIVPGLVLSPPKMQGPPKPPGYGQPTLGSEAWRVAQQTSGSMSYTPAAPKVQGPPKPPGYQGNNAPNPFGNVGQNNNAFSNFGQTSGSLSNMGQPGAQPGSEAWRVQNASNAGGTQPSTVPGSGGFVNGQNPYSQYGLDYQKSLVLEKFMQEAMLAQKVMGPNYFPDRNTALFLEQNGYIRPKATVAAFNPAYADYKKLATRGGGGGGGGGGGSLRPASAGKVQQPEGLPAFGNGSSFRGLVNWRI